MCLENITATPAPFRSKMLSCNNVLIDGNEMQGMRDGIYFEFADSSTIRKFEINPIPHSLHFIAIDQYVVAMPEMDPVSGSRFSFSNGAYIIVTDDSPIGLLKINTEVHIFQNQILNQKLFTVHHPDRCIIFCEASIDIFDDKTVDCHTVRLDLNDFAKMFTIDGRIINSYQCQWFV